MNARPLSVTIIAWYLILSSILSALSLATMSNNPMVREIMEKSSLPVSVQIAMGVVGVALALVCGVGMLQGMNWARLTWVGWSLVGLAISLATSPMTSMVVLGIPILALIFFFLFRKPANDFFAGAREGIDVAPNP